MESTFWVYDKETHITASIWGAKQLAKRAHAGQVDKAGKDYFEGHIMTVYEAVPDGCAKIVALLHDILEDTNTTMEFLKKMEFPSEVYPAIEVLTRNPDDTYQQYIDKVKGNPLAVTVKLADLAHNIDASRFPEYPNLTEEQKSLLARYEKAKQTLLAAEEK